MRFLGKMSGSLQNPQEMGHGIRKQAGNEDSKAERGRAGHRRLPPAAGHSFQSPLPLGIGPGPWVLPSPARKNSKWHLLLGTSCSSSKWMHLIN